MPFRPVLSPASLRLTRQFHNSAIRKVHDTNHYDTLQVPTNATPQAIKKSFYALSKRHHPDHNPDDPEASTRFVKISEAYAVLGTPEKRLRYDRDFMRANPTSVPHTHRHGSYHSSGPAGGRPASGLSKRRTHFQGPPPSFYRNGAWGDHGAKRQAAHDGAASSAANAANSAAGSSMGGGMGPGQQPFGTGSDVPHFDRQGHRRTQEHQDIRRQRRNGYDSIPIQPSSGVLVNFVLMGSIIALATVIPTLLYERSTRKTKSEKKT